MVKFHTPDIPHQSAVGDLLVELGTLIRDTGMGEVFQILTGVVLSDTEVVLPDMLFVSRERLRIIEHAVIRGAPDLVIEVLSPSTERRDRVVKREMYARHGVMEYWLVDAGAKTITQLLMGAGPDFDAVGVFGPGESLTSPTLGGFELDQGMVV